MLEINGSSELFIQPHFVEIRCQGGDPTGTGKGGQSIYGGYFEDTLRH